MVSAMIHPKLNNIEDIIRVLVAQYGEPTHFQNGREINMGNQTGARYTGPGWAMWTDHYRDAKHFTKVRVFLEFNDPYNETLFRLKYPDLCG
jgi:hypothetical protein